MSRRTGYLCVALAGVFWGLSGVFSRIAIDGGIEPLELGAWRGIAAALILLPFVLLHVRLINRSMLVPIALFGIIGIVAWQGLFFEAIARIDIALAMVIVYTAPIPVAAYQRLRLSEILPLKAYLGMLIAIVGVSMAALGSAGGITEVNGIGLAFAFATMLATGAQVVLAARQPAALPPLARTGASMVVAAACWMVIVPVWTLPFGVLDALEPLQGRIDVDVPVWAAVLWVIVFGSILPYLLLIVGAPRIGPGATSIVTMVEPIVAAFVAWLALGQSLTVVEIAGIAIALVAIAYVERARVRAARATEL